MFLGANKTLSKHCKYVHFLGGEKDMRIGRKLLYLKKVFLSLISMNTSVSDSPFCCSAGDAEAVVKSVSPFYF